MTRVFAASACLIVCILMEVLFLRIRAIRKNTAHSVKRYDAVLLVFIFISLITGFFSPSVPIAAAFLGAVCVILMLSLMTADNTYKKQYNAFITQTEQMKEQLENAQKPDEAALRAKELLPVGNDFLIHAAETIHNNRDVTRILSFINKIMIERLFADGGVILTIGEFEDVLSVKAYDGIYPPPYKLPDDVPHKKDRVITNFKYAEFPLNDSFFGTAALSAKPILIQNAQTDSRIVVNGNEPFLKSGSLLTLPMIYNDNVTGIISLSRSTDQKPFTENDIEIGEILAGYATAALKLVYDFQEETELHTIENEMDIASRIQKLLLPKKLVDTAALHFSVLFNQARGVCSDYYDVIKTPNGRTVCVIADIAGKSIHACIVMVTIRALLYLITGTARSDQNILDLLNKGMIGKLSIDQYASISLLTYIPEEHCIEYINAGTQSLLLWKQKTKTMSKLEQKTDPIGIDTKSVYRCKKLPVEKGDIAVLFTDGVVETLNQQGEPFGLKALAGLLTEYHALSAQEIAKKINQHIKSFIGSTSPHDDQTMMVVKVK